MESKYLTECRYCKEEFKSNHLNRKYCNETCKRAAFRDKNSNVRKQISNNAKILSNLFKTSNETTLKILENNGFNLNYFYKVITFTYVKIYVINENYDLMIEKDKITIIKQ